MEDPKHYFYRIRVERTEDEVEAWHQQQLKPILYDMRAWVESEYKWPAYYNPKALITKGGNLTSMAKVVMTGELIGYRQKKHPFMELQ